MDPQATWNSLLEECADGNWLDVFELAEALLEWLSKEGLGPSPSLQQAQFKQEWFRKQTVDFIRVEIVRLAELRCFRSSV